MFVLNSEPAGQLKSDFTFALNIFIITIVLNHTKSHVLLNDTSATTPGFGA